MTCANCNADALYIYQITLDKVVPYCDKHLPSFLSDRKKAGLLPTTDAYKALLANVHAPKAEPAPVEEPAVEPTVEEVATEPDTTTTPTSAKKTVKKTATKNATNS